MAQNQKKIKRILKNFKELDIAIQRNMKTVIYLDVTLNIENCTYRLYQKENN